MRNEEIHIRRFYIMSSIKLTDLISVQVLQEIQDGFAEVTGMAALTTDADGNPVTKGSNFTDFCMKYTRRSKLGCERCEKCDRDGGERTQRTGKAAAYSCHGGLMDFAAPIMVDGEFIGSFIGGQVLTEKPDEAKFRKIAKELGIDPDEYIAALRKVKIVPKEKVEAAARFLHTIAKNISSMAYSSYQLKLHNESLAGNLSANSDVIKRVNDIAGSCISAVSSMDEKFRQLSELADRCVSEVKTASDAAKVIQDIAMNTRILGFNASIEASRAKESGKGFGVIAQEVRSLAETSKSSADKIEDKIKSIGEFTSQIDSSAKNAAELVAEAVSGIEELKSVIGEIEA